MVGDISMNLGGGGVNEPQDVGWGLEVGAGKWDEEAGEGDFGSR